MSRIQSIAARIVTAGTAGDAGAGDVDRRRAVGVDEEIPYDERTELVHRVAGVLRLVPGVGGDVATTAGDDERRAAAHVSR
jgi:hypothetical protein